MAAYASHQREPSGRAHLSPTNRPQLATAATPVAVGQVLERASLDSVVVSQLLDLLVDRVAAAVAERLGESANEDEWFDSRHAAGYLGVHRDTLRKLAAERAIPSDQDGPGCKLYFRRSDLDVWRRSGGRPRHVGLAAVA